MCPICCRQELHSGAYWTSCQLKMRNGRLCCSWPRTRTSPTRKWRKCRCRMNVIVVSRSRNVIFRFHLSSLNFFDECSRKLQKYEFCLVSLMFCISSPRLPSTSINVREKWAANLKLPRAFLMFHNPLEEYLCYLPNNRNKFTTKNPLFNKHYAEIC